MTEGEVATQWPPRAPVPPREPISFQLIGVRCPRCHLGGDIPDTIERTVCPRCETVFTVATARVDRPATPAGQPTSPTPPPSPASPPSAPAAFDMERRISPERRQLSERRVVPERRNGVPSPRPTPPRPAPAPTSPRVGGRPGEIPLTPPPLARPPQWPKLLIGGLAVFTAGLLVGWALTRDAAEGAEQLRSPLSVDGAAPHPSTTAATAIPPNPADPSPSPPRADSTTGESDAHSAADNAQPAADGSPTPSGAGGAHGTASGPAGRDATAAMATTSVAAPSNDTGGGAAPQACSGLDCRMSATSPVEGIPLPDDSSELATPDGFYGWTTEAASVEALTAWYRAYLSEHGWRLATEYSVMDPTQGQARNLGYSTSAIYCRSDGHGAVAVNIGLPLNTGGGLTVVMAIAKAPQPLNCG